MPICTKEKLSIIYNWLALLVPISGGKWRKMLKKTAGKCRHTYTHLCTFKCAKWPIFYAVARVVRSILDLLQSQTFVYVLSLVNRNAQDIYARPTLLSASGYLKIHINKV